MEELPAGYLHTPATLPARRDSCCECIGKSNHGFLNDQLEVVPYVCPIHSPAPALSSDSPVEQQSQLGHRLLVDPSCAHLSLTKQLLTELRSRGWQVSVVRTNFQLGEAGGTRARDGDVAWVITDLHAKGGPRSLLLWVEWDRQSHYYLPLPAETVRTIAELHHIERMRIDFQIASAALLRVTPLGPDMQWARDPSRALRSTMSLITQLMAAPRLGTHVYFVNTSAAMQTPENLAGELQLAGLSDITVTCLDR